MYKNFACLTICLLLLMASGLFSSDYHFLPNGDYPVGTAPYSICSGDFDGDLDSDLAVANYLSSSISILLNNGDGTFATAVNYDVGGWPRDIIAGDFAGDLEIDLAVTSWSPNGFAILEGNGDGTFRDTVVYVPTGMDQPSGPYSICSGDFDNDSDNDIAIAYDLTDNVGIYLNQDNTSFSYFWKYATGDHPWDVISHDLDGDNFGDLIVLNYFEKTISVLIGQGNGSFDMPANYPSSGAGAQQIFLADMNGDNEMDLIGGIGGTYGGYDIYTGNGDGTFGAPFFTDSVGYTARVFVADLDKDTDFDLAFANIATDSIAIVMNEGGGMYSDPSVYYGGGDGSGAIFIYAVDLNGDMYNDLAVANGNLNSITILINDGSGGFPTDVADDRAAALPDKYMLTQNYPNPFNPSTVIEFDIPIQSRVKITVFNMVGQKVTELVNGNYSAGSHSITWDGVSSNGQRVSSGIYFYRIVAGDFIDSKKMILLK